MNHLILSALAARNDRDWIGGADAQRIGAIAHQKFQELADSNNRINFPKILLCETNPEQFLGKFLAAVAADCPIFLGNPHWGAQEWQQVLNLVQPDIIWGNCLEKYVTKTEQSSHKFNSTWLQCDPPKSPLKRGTFFDPPFLRGARGDRDDSREKCCNFSENRRSGIMIPTGGSSGKIRFAIHTWETLTASVRGFREYFQVSNVHSFCLLPIYHVSGLMQFVRSFTTGGRLAILPSYKNILEIISSESGAAKIEQQYLDNIDLAAFFISLVPTQLSRLLQNPIAADWLSQFKTVLLGGAPAWPQLLEKARQYQINLAPTYGMTETGSQVVTLKPREFLAGNHSCGQVLPHARVTICAENGQKLGINQIGMITIQAESLSLGYYPQRYRTAHFNNKNMECADVLPNVQSKSQATEKPPDFISDDLGFFDADGYLNIVGRRSDKIITGGENVFPAEVEAAIRTTGLVTDVCAIGLPDLDWGQAIGVVYVPSSDAVSVSSLTQALVDRLAKFKQPKYWVPVAKLPRNAQGKINRASLYEIAADRCRV